MIDDPMLRHSIETIIYNKATGDVNRKTHDGLVTVDAAPVDLPWLQAVAAAADQ